MKLKFGQYFAADVWLRLNLSQDYEARFGQYFKLVINGDTVVWLRSMLKGSSKKTVF